MGDSGICLHMSRLADIGGHRANALIEMKGNGIEMVRLVKTIKFLSLHYTFRVAMRSGDTPVPIPNTMVKT